MVKPGETYHLNPPIQVEDDWMIELTSLEVYNFSFNVSKHSNKFKLYKYPDTKSVSVSYEKIRDEIEKDLDISEFKTINLKDDIIGPNIVKEYREQVTKKET